MALVQEVEIQKKMLVMGKRKRKVMHIRNAAYTTEAITAVVTWSALPGEGGAFRKHFSE